MFCIKKILNGLDQVEGLLLWPDGSTQAEMPCRGWKRMRISMPDGSRREISRAEASIEEILKELGVNPEEVIVAKNGRIVPEDETAGGSDQLKIVRFVHGG
jgi:sulfur carrier protein